MENLNNELKVLENELVPVYETSTGEKVVYGTKLHEVLGVKTAYKDWSVRRFNDVDAIENQDYEVLLKNEQNSKGGRPIKEHIIKLNIAKEMAMLERNDKGKQVRRYFIEVEKKYKENLMAVPKDYSSALRLAADEYDKRMIAENKLNKANRQLELQKPFVQTALKLQNTDDTVSMEQAAKLLSDNGVDIGRNTLMKVLREHGILMGNNSPYEKYKKTGLFKVKMSVKENHYGVKAIPVTRVTGKGLIFLDKKLRECFSIEDSGIDIDFDAIFNMHKYDWLDNM